MNNENKLGSDQTETKIRIEKVRNDPKNYTKKRSEMTPVVIEKGAGYS